MLASANETSDLVNTVNTTNLGNLLFPLPYQEKHLIRRLEKSIYKLNSAETAVVFNQTCLQEGLLPRYTNLRLHDPSTANDRHTLAFRRRLAERQLAEKKEEARRAHEVVEGLKLQWDSLQSNEDRVPIKNILQSLQEKDKKKKEEAILCKLIKLNGGKLRLPQQRKNYINLTDYIPSKDEEDLLQLGLNCHYADKINPRDKRLEVEVLLDSLINLEKSSKVELSDSLRPLLLAEALTNRAPNHHRSSIISKELQEATKKLKNTEGITIRRADKTPALVLIKTDEYQHKLDTILADETKFQRIRRNPIEDIKKEANRTIERVNAMSSSVKFPKIKGDYEPGYIYGNVKTHKNGNPLRPIISQIPTPTYHLAKQLNQLLTPYIPSKYRVKSSAEFLQAIRGSSSEGTIASLDVESLFTNVPVEETISMMCNKVYRDDSTPALPIPEDSLRDLLRLCTMKAPFITHRGEMYTQVDGVAMGSPLGVLFADFYMGVVEERVFSQHPEPQIYCRYVDDTFIKTDNPAAVEELRQKFEECSSLRFTSENSDNGSLPFLDVLLSQHPGENFSTKVYRKPTNMGLCLNGKSECPERYCNSTIDSYIRRALTHCSTWISTSEEIDAARQMLVNNGFTNKAIDRQVRKSIDKWYTQSQPTPEEDTISLFYKSHYHQEYKKEEKALKEIINNHVKPTNNCKINLVIYYKSKKTCNLILKNNPSCNQDMLRRRNVVYHFECPEVECQHEYIGMTTMRLSKRISCHLQEGAIFQHYVNSHNKRPSRDALLKSIKISGTCNDHRRLRILEALLILEHKPSLNCTQEPLLLPSMTQPPQRLINH